MKKIPDNLQEFTELTHEFSKITDQRSVPQTESFQND